jgi:hypothetical protein
MIWDIQDVEAANLHRRIGVRTTTGCSVTWLARLHGVQKVAGSNPVTPTYSKSLPNKELYYLPACGSAAFSQTRKTVTTVFPIGDPHHAVSFGPAARVSPFSTALNTRRGRCELEEQDVKSQTALQLPKLRAPLHGGLGFIKS